jgi:hypothetical protein
MIISAAGNGLTQFARHNLCRLNMAPVSGSITSMQSNPPTTISPLPPVRRTPRYDSVVMLHICGGIGLASRVASRRAEGNI